MWGVSRSIKILNKSIQKIYVDKTKFTSKNFSNLFLQLLNLVDCTLEQNKTTGRN